MSGITACALLGIGCAIGQHIADRRFHDDAARLLTFAACVLLLAAFAALAAEVAL